MTRLRILTALSVVCLLLGGAAEGQAQRAMTLVDLLEVPRLSDPQLSPDGGHVLYVLAEADWEANRAISHIWRADADGSNTVQLTRGEDGESNPRWSPDGDLVAFLAARGTADTAQIHVLSNQGGEARQLTHHPTAVSSIAWSPDGRSIHFLAADEKSAEEQAREAEQDDVYAFEENFQHRHLWTVTVATGATARVTEGDYSVIDYDLSRDGTRIALHRAPSPVLEYRDASEVWVMGADGSDPRRLTTNAVPESGAQVSPDGSRLLFLSRANQRFEKYYNSNVFVVPAEGGPATVLAPDLPYELSDAAWSADGDAVFAVVNMGVHSELFRLDVATGEAEQLTDGRHSIGAWNLETAAGQHVLILRRPHNPGDVWLLDTGAGAAPTRVTRVFDYLRDFRLPRQEKAQWTGADGVTVEGLLFYPLDYEEGRRYPLVIQTHGGPQASDKFGFGAPRNSIQVLAALGYFVLQPNYRGSTGYGDAFLRDMVGGYFKNAHLDVIAGADHLIAAGLVDGERMAKMGWSGGGHMTNK
ncbi:MAG: S9 family peptidase, partial [Acidobacteria bacterium]|nr:S9 family peptidase [Acidobacteriota bacterium]